MASFDKLTRANMMKYMREEMDEPQHKDSLKKAVKGEKEKEDDERRKTFEKRNKQFEEDKKVMPPRRSRD